MARVKGGMSARRKHNKVLKLAKGYRGARSKQYRVAKQSVMRALTSSYAGRKERKRQMRQLLPASACGSAAYPAGVRPVRPPRPGCYREPTADGQQGVHHPVPCGHTLFRNHRYPPHWFRYTPRSPGGVPHRHSPRLHPASLEYQRVSGVFRPSFSIHAASCSPLSL